VAQDRVEPWLYQACMALAHFAARLYAAAVEWTERSRRLPSCASDYSRPATAKAAAASSHRLAR